MSNKSDYIPKNVNAFVIFMQNMLDYVNRHQAEWGHIPAAVIANLAGLLQALLKVQTGAAGLSTSAQKLARREAQAEATKAVRAFVNQYMRFAPVTNVDRLEVGVPNRDNTPTTVPVPTIQAIGTLRFPGVGLVDMYDIKPDSMGADDKARYGVRIHLGIISQTSRFRITQPPKTGADLPYSVFTRRSRHRFDFMGEHGNVVYFCLRYENSKGQAGPWGKIITSFIP